MIKVGEAPYLECSGKGDRRFSAMFARIRGRMNLTIERIYQGTKVFEGGVTGLSIRDAKGKRALNQEFCNRLYRQLWLEYLVENPDYIMVLVEASGLSDMFGQEGHVCQATTLWDIRNEFLSKSALSS